jgi:cytochrome P450
MVDYNPFSQEVMRNPLPVYAKLREEAPCYYIAEYDAWALSRFEDIWTASMDNEHFSAAQGTTSSHLLTKVQPVTPMINLMDPPQHTKLRAQVRKHFAPAAIRDLEPTIRELASGCLDAAAQAGEVDAMSGFASQVAVKVACMVNGIPLEDGDMLNDLVWRFFAREPGVDGMTPDGLAAMGELFGYFIELSQARRKSGSNAEDVVNLLNHIELDGKKLDDEAIASHMSMFIIGGAETFPKTFANALHRLWEYSDQRAQCAEDPSLIPDAFQEVLRYDMPTQFLCRIVIKELEIHGQELKPGQPILFLYPSANRDPREFEKPDVFDIQRRAPRILSFGHGTHSCIGLHVAKMEAKVCIEETLKRIPDYEVDLERAERLVTDFVQGYASLPITFRPS